MLSQMMDSKGEFIPFFTAKRLYQLGMVYRIPWHQLCTAVFQLELPHTQT